MGEKRDPTQYGRLPASTEFPLLIRVSLLPVSNLVAGVRVAQARCTACSHHGRDTVHVHALNPIVRVPRFHFDLRVLGNSL